MGKAVAQHAAKEWLRRHRGAKERTSSLAELAAAELNSPLRIGKLDNAIEGLGFRAAEQLESFLAGELRGLPDNELAAAADAAVHALRSTDLSDDALFAVDADPEELARTVRRRIPAQAGLSEAATVLCERMVDQGCRYLIQVVRHLPAFQPRALAEVLDRLSTVNDQLTELLAQTPRTSLHAPRGTTHDAEFRAEYLRYLATRLDRLDLLGLSMQHRPRLALSVAYLSLTVSEPGRRPHQSGLWFGPEGERNRTSTVRVEAAIGDASRTLIRGEAGSGKTTLLDWLAITAARGGFTDSLTEWNGCVPFPLRLRRFADTDLPRPEHFLDDAAPWLVGLMPDGWVHRCLRSGTALLLVDGVDEMPAARRRAVRHWLGELVAAYPQARVVVTSRPAAAEERWLAEEGFSSVVLEQMSAGDVRLFLQRWHEAAAGAKSLPCEPQELPAAQRRLLAQLDARPHLRALAANPLLCAMLCALNLGRTSDLPRNRMELYQAAIAMLVDLRDAERNIVSLLDVSEKTVLLRDLAWRLMLGNRSELPRAKALDLVTRKLPAMPNVDEQPGKVLDHLLERSGIIREPVPDRVDFVHRTFQEYLAASEATEEEHIPTLVSHAHLDIWRETVIMACGHAKRSQSRELLTDILDRADAEPRRARHLRLLAAACLETITEIDPDLRQRIDRVITTRLVPPRDLRETRSLSAMGHRLLRYLPDTLDELSEAAATAAVRAVALTGDVEALPRLARYGLDQRWDVQQQVFDAWQYFDPKRYADEVLADMPLLNGGLTVRLARLLPYVRRLSNIERLRVDLREHHGIDDLSILNDLPNVTFIALENEGVVDLAPLAEHKNLDSVFLFGALRYREVQTLWKLSSLTALLIYPENPQNEIEFVRKLTELDLLGLSSLGNTTDYTPLSQLADLTNLVLYDCEKMTDLDAISHLTKLRSLHLVGSPIPDVASKVAETFPLLNELSLRRTTLHDLSPLTSLDLNRLDITGCPVDDLSPMSGRKMTIVATKNQEYRGVRDLGPNVRIQSY